MGRKRNAKYHHSPEIGDPTDDVNNDSLYHKRLRSWKQTSSQLKSNHLSSSIDDNDNRMQSRHKSTIFTYPINLRQNTESLTTESAFYGSSIAYHSIGTPAALNNNQITTLNTEIRKRKTCTTLCESISTELSSSPDDETSIDSLHLKNSTKRSRISTDNSIIIKNYDDDCTIDINQLDRQEPISSSIDDKSLVNNSNSMEVAVKMVQPIVDIIFNAFEDQLKNIQTKPIQSPCLNSILTSPFHRPVTIPYFPSLSPIHPIILHAVNFDIQLTTKDPTKKSTCTSLNDNSYFLSNEYLIRKYKLKRIVQLALVGASVLCGYLFL